MAEQRRKVDLWMHSCIFIQAADHPRAKSRGCQIFLLLSLTIVAGVSHSFLVGTIRAADDRNRKTPHKMAEPVLKKPKMSSFLDTLGKEVCALDFYFRPQPTEGACFLASRSWIGSGKRNKKRPRKTCPAIVQIAHSWKLLFALHVVALFACLHPNIQVTWVMQPWCFNKVESYLLWPCLIVWAGELMERMG